MPDLCYLYTLTSESTSQCFIQVCEVTEALLHIWEAQPDLHSAAPQGGKGPAEINEGQSFKNLGAQGFFLSATISTMNTKCTASCFMWLFLHVCFCSAPTKDFCLIHLFRFLVSATLQLSWIQQDIPKAHCSVSIC